VQQKVTVDVSHGPWKHGRRLVQLTTADGFKLQITNDVLVRDGMVVLFAVGLEEQTRGIRIVLPPAFHDRVAGSPPDCPFAWNMAVDEVVAKARRGMLGAWVHDGPRCSSEAGALRRRGYVLYDDIMCDSQDPKIWCIGGQRFELCLS
jgi:hypothetical protein